MMDFVSTPKQVCYSLYPVTLLLVLFLCYRGFFFERMLLTAGGGLFTMAEDTTFTMYRWSASMGILSFGLE